MASTLLDLIHEVWDVLETTPQRNKLASALTSSGDTVTVTYALGGIQDGARLSVDLEDMYVWDTPSSTTATVQRGDFGSTAAAHTSGSIVYVNPVATPFEILRAVNDELVELSNPRTGVYREQVDTFTFNAAVYGYDLVSGADDVVGVFYDSPGTEQNWVRIPRERWRFNPNADTSDFPSGRSLTLLDPGFPGYTVRVVYKGAFSTMDALDDNVASSTGLPARAHNILKYGAALRVMAGRSYARVSMGSQGDTRRAGEVSTSDVLRAPARIEDLYRRAVAAEAAELKR